VCAPGATTARVAVFGALQPSAQACPVKFSLQPRSQKLALRSHFPPARRPGVREPEQSIRGRSYGANTCSLHCGHSHSHSARSPRSGSHARSFCSRTTIASTGRSTGASQPALVQSGRRCASASRNAIPATGDPGRRRARPSCALRRSMRQVRSPGGGAGDAIRSADTSMRVKAGPLALVSSRARAPACPPSVGSSDAAVRRN
jgi:hypothetical protein